MKQHKKGQAAMEYLMTYGWAILAIVIVIAALLYLNPFGAPELCMFQQQGLSCSEPNPDVYVDTDGNLKMNVRLWNRLGRTIYVHDILCTDSTAEAGVEHAMAVPQTDGRISTGTHGDIKDISCKDRNGNNIQMSPNQEFRGRMIVWYQYDDPIDPDLKHQSQANVISLVVQQ